MNSPVATHHFQPLDRTPAQGGEPMRVPALLPGTPGRAVVDTTWGTIQPIQLHPDVRTVGELEVIEQLRSGLPLIDTRRPAAFAAGTIPGARSLPHTELGERIGELDPLAPAILFCNGPQCAATPNAIRLLIDRGYPALALRYYRGGMHDWVTLGLPITPGSSSLDAD